MNTTTKRTGFGQRIIGLCGIAAVALSLGLGSAAAGQPSYQPGDAAGHAAADLRHANERQAAALSRTTEARWSGDAAGTGAAELRATDEREAAAVARNADTVVFGQYGLAGLIERLDR